VSSSPPVCAAEARGRAFVRSLSAACEHAWPRIVIDHETAATAAQKINTLTTPQRLAWR
jgi:hypothetical protein